VNWSRFAKHFAAILWLRWRLRVNQVKKHGPVNAILTAMFVAAAIPGTIVLFIATFSAGAFTVPFIDEAIRPKVLMYSWDGVLFLFFVSWGIGLVAELQRAEALSMDRFLHMPVSLSSVFLINFLSSLLSLTLLIAVPAMVGFTLGVSVGVTPLWLLVLPLIAAFLLAVTALTYQFQGWLATLMANPRRRRTIVVGLTMLMILTCQVPNLINMLQPWNPSRFAERATKKAAEDAKLHDQLQKGEIDGPEFARRRDELNKKFDEETNVDPNTIAYIELGVWLVNVMLPPGWVALGAAGATEGNAIPALLGTLGLGLIGAGSLWRAYHTTIRLYTGDFTGGTARPVPAPVVIEKKPAAPAGTMLLERTLPLLSERAAAITFASFRALMRAPEAKMILLSPLILVLIFGSMFLSGNFHPPVIARPFLGFAAMSIVLMGMAQLIGNQFAFDRNGFRVFVLCPAPRRDIILGKNMAMAPVVLGMGAVLILVVEILTPMRIDHFFLVLIQCVVMYLLYCLLANTLSILAPMPVSAGSLKPANPKALQVLLHIAFAFVFPIIMAPVLVPLLVDLLLSALDWTDWFPAGLILMILEGALAVFIYHVVLGWQGKLLHAREQKILEIVTAKAE
jgi:hypothetical protein